MDGQDEGRPMLLLAGGNHRRLLGGNWSTASADRNKIQESEQVGQTEKEAKLGGGQGQDALVKTSRGKLLGCHRAHQRLKDLEALGRAQFWLAGAFRVGHHAEHVTVWAADAGYVVERAVGIGLRRDLTV